MYVYFLTLKAFCFEAGSFTELSSLFSLGWLATKLLSSACLCCYNASVTGGHSHLYTCTRGSWGFKPRTLCLYNKHSYLLHHHPNLHFSAFWKVFWFANYCVLSYSCMEWILTRKFFHVDAVTRQPRLQFLWRLMGVLGWLDSSLLKDLSLPSSIPLWSLCTLSAWISVLHSWSLGPQEHRGGILEALRLWVISAAMVSGSQTSLWSI